MMPIVVVEPHADDAFLSLGAHLVRWHAQGTPTVICTVFPKSERRAREGREYAVSVGALHTTCAALSKPTPVGVATAIEYALQVIGVSGPLALVGPLGIKHPEHILVAHAVAFIGAQRTALSGVSDGLYVDTPYQTVQRNGAELADKLYGRGVISYLTPPKAKWKAAALFTSQALFFRYNPPERLAKVPEIIVGSQKECVWPTKL